MNTEDCQIFLQNYYNEKHIITELHWWKLQKKYKNFDNIACRDFVCIEKQLKVIMILTDEISVIENENFEFFLNNRIKESNFCFVPFVVGNKVAYYFAKKEFKNYDSIVFNAPDWENLQKSLRMIFKIDDISFIDKEMIVYFPTIYNDEVIKRLKSNSFELNERMIKIFVQKKYELYEDIKISGNNELSYVNSEESINKLFKIYSENVKVDSIDYEIIKNLLKNVAMKDLEFVGEMLNEFKYNKDKKLEILVAQELNIRNK